jgi:primosomal protein N' (replication factor Y)
MPLFAKLALETPKPFLDTVYDYAVPPELYQRCKPGCRVIVPFGRGNRRVEGFVLSVTEQCGVTQVKPVISVLDDLPLLDRDALQLALWLRERFYCTCYSALKAMLPAGLWLRKKELCQARGTETEAEALLTIYPAALQLWRRLNQSKKPVPRDKIIRTKSDEADWQALTDNGLAEMTVQDAPRVTGNGEQFFTLAAETDELTVKGKNAPVQAAVLKLLRDAGGPVAWSELRYYTGAAKTVLYALLKSGLVEPFEPIGSSAAYAAAEAETMPVLTDAQETVLNGLIKIAGGKAACALLHGVTGSGKTAVYIRLIEYIIQSNGQVLVMAPEIALTPQLLARFRACFGNRVAILHSGLTVADRVSEWRRIRDGQADVVVGTRSAVFAPLTNCKLIIMDEEHEDTYKSDNMPRYHARDAAKFRSRQNSALLLLGSATPSVDTMQAARSGEIAYFSLPGRYNAGHMPSVYIADLRAALENGENCVIGQRLAQELKENISRGEQTILFVNRRGRDRLLFCPACEKAPQCPACSTALVHHSANRRLMCHYCGFSKTVSQTCQNCGKGLKPIGFGTQRVTEVLHELFPETEVLRMDTDTTAGRGAHEAILNRFRDEKIPVLVGTQMVAKGLDFENVTLIGVLSADAALHSTDYRANERTFSLITQVVGRAGRGSKPGRAVLQTFSPGNPVLKAAAAQDYEAFFQAELPLRQARQLPPFSEVLLLRLSGEDNERTKNACADLTMTIKDMFPSLRVYGPAAAALFRYRFRYRYQTVLNGRYDRSLRQRLASVFNEFAKQNSDIVLTIDAKPGSL